MKKLIIVTLAITCVLASAVIGAGVWAYWYNELRWVELEGDFEGYFSEVVDGTRRWGLRFVVTNDTSQLFHLDPVLRYRRDDGVLLETEEFTLEPRGQWRLTPNDTSLLLVRTGFTWPEDLPTQSNDESESASRKRVTAFVDGFENISSVLVLDAENRIRSEVPFGPTIEEWTSEYELEVSED